MNISLMENNRSFLNNNLAFKLELSSTVQEVQIRNYCILDNTLCIFAIFSHHYCCRHILRKLKLKRQCIITRNKLLPVIKDLKRLLSIIKRLFCLFFVSMRDVSVMLTLFLYCFSLCSKEAHRDSTIEFEFEVLVYHRLLDSDVNFTKDHVARVIRWPVSLDEYQDVCVFIFLLKKTLGCTHLFN